MKNFSLLFSTIITTSLIATQSHAIDADLCYQLHLSENETKARCEKAFKEGKPDGKAVEGFKIYQNDSNPQRSLSLIKEAAYAGDPLGMYWLADIYRTGGEGKSKGIVKQDFEDAFYWFKKSAEAGFPMAAMRLSFAYQKGKGTCQNAEKANYWYQWYQKSEN